jgi:hypothetical protein
MYLLRSREGSCCLLRVVSAILEELVGHTPSLRPVGTTLLVEAEHHL